MFRLHSDDIQQIVDGICAKIADKVIQPLNTHCQEEMSMTEICGQLKISRDTIRRRYRNGQIPQPEFKRGENYFLRSDIEAAIRKGIL